MISKLATNAVAISEGKSRYRKYVYIINHTYISIFKNAAQNFHL